MLEQSVQDDSALRQLVDLHDLSLKALNAKNIDEILFRGVEILEEVFHAALVRIWMMQPDGNLQLKASKGISQNASDSSPNSKNCPRKVARIASTREPF